MNPQLLDYIKNERARGVLDVEIRSALISAGWAQADVDDAIGLGSLRPRMPGMPGSTGAPGAGAPSLQASMAGIAFNSVQPQPKEPQYAPVQFRNQGTNPAQFRPQSKSHTGFIITMAIVVLLGVGGYFAFDYLFPSAPTPGTLASLDTAVTAAVAGIKADSVSYLDSNNKSYKGFCTSAKANAALARIVTATGGDRTNVRCTDSDTEFAVSAMSSSNRYVCIDSASQGPIQNGSSLHMGTTCGGASGAAPTPTKAPVRLTDEEQIQKLIKDSFTAERNAKTTGEALKASTKYYLPIVVKTVNDAAAALHAKVSTTTMDKFLSINNLTMPPDLSLGGTTFSVKISGRFATTTIEQTLSENPDTGEQFDTPQTFTFAIVTEKPTSSWRIHTTYAVEKGTLTSETGYPVLAKMLKAEAASLGYIRSHVEGDLRDLHAIFKSSWNGKEFAMMKNATSVPGLASYTASSTELQQKVDALVTDIQAYMPEKGNLKVFGGGKTSQAPTGFTLYASQYPGGYVCISSDSPVKSDLDKVIVKSKSMSSVVPTKVVSASKCQ